MATVWGSGIEAAQRHPSLCCWRLSVIPFRPRGCAVWLTYVLSANKASYLNRQWHCVFFYLKNAQLSVFVTTVCSINNRLTDLMADSSNTPKEVGIFGSKVRGTSTIYAIQFDSPFNRITHTEWKLCITQFLTTRSVVSCHLNAVLTVLCNLYSYTFFCTFTSELTCIVLWCVG